MVLLLCLLESIPFDAGFPLEGAGLPVDTQTVLKGLLESLDLQVSQCCYLSVDKVSKMFQEPSSSPSSLAQLAAARLTQVSCQYKQSHPFSRGS